MRLVLKQRMFSWFDSYDVCDEYGNAVFSVKGRLSWGHLLEIYNSAGCKVGVLKEKILKLLPTFEIYINDSYVGCIKKEFTFFKPKFDLDFCGWNVSGDFFGWDYSVYNGGVEIMRVSKELLHLTDTYVIDVFDDNNALAGLLIALAIDAEKCSNGG